MEHFLIIVGERNQGFQQFSFFINLSLTYLKWDSFKKLTFVAGVTPHQKEIESNICSWRMDQDPRKAYASLANNWKSPQHETKSICQSIDNRECTCQLIDKWITRGKKED